MIATRLILFMLALNDSFMRAVPLATIGVR